MTIWPDDYIRYVLDDIKQCNRKNQITKAGLIERIRVKKVNPFLLHPNPDDEFSMEHIGPSLEIVTNYIKSIRKLDQQEIPIFEEPVICEKLKQDGYLIVNGHHRWFAALRAGVKKLHVRIVNLVHTEDVNRMLNASANTKRVSFDLDEVLLARNTEDASYIVDSAIAKKVPVHLRKGVSEVFRAFQARNYDIWVYTADYYSEGEINLLFEAYDLKITGVINGISAKRADLAECRKSMNRKYQETIHIDNESLLITRTDKTMYEHTELEDAADWSGSILKIIEKR